MTTAPLYRSLVAATFLAVAAAAAASPSALYIMESHEGGAELRVIRFADAADPASSPYEIGEPVDMNAQLSGAGSVRDLHVLADGQLLVELDGPAPRLSIWSPEGIYDRDLGRFGGMAHGSAARAEGGFFYHDREDRKVHVQTATFHADTFTVRLVPPPGSAEELRTRDGRLAGRAGGGLILGLGWLNSPAVAVFRGEFSGGPIERTPDVVGRMRPLPKDTGFFAPFPGGWAARGTSTEWIIFPEEANAEGEFEGTVIEGTAGGRIVDLTPFGPGHTAVLYMSWEDPGRGIDAVTSHGQAVIQIWDNEAVLAGPVRTIDLGFNLRPVKEAWNRAKLAGPWITKQ